MRLKQFLSDLRKCDDLEWRVKNGLVRCSRSGVSLCPITCLVVNLDLSPTFSTGEVFEAGDALGIPWRIRDAIVIAADNSQPERFRHRIVRKALLEACGLTE